MRFFIFDDRIGHQLPGDEAFLIPEPNLQEKDQVRLAGDSFAGESLEGDRPFFDERKDAEMLDRALQLWVRFQPLQQRVI